MPPDAPTQHTLTKRQNQILDAAEAVFAAKGFHSTTIRDVAREAGVADGTIYNAFANKHALLLGIFARMHAAVVASAPPAPPAGTPDAHALLTALLRHPLDALRANNAALFRVVLSEMLVNAELQALYGEQVLAPTITAAEHALTAWAAQGVLPPLDVPLAARTLTGTVMGLLLARAVGDSALNDDATWDALPAFLANLLLHGLQGDAP